jgi:hypothetical protein
MIVGGWRLAIFQHDEISSAWPPPPSCGFLKDSNLKKIERRTPRVNGIIRPKGLVDQKAVHNGNVVIA